MRMATGGDVVLAGFRLTREEWDDLDAESRALLLESDDEDDGAQLELPSMRLPSIGHRHHGDRDVRGVSDDGDEQPYVSIEVLVEQLEPDEAAAHQLLG